jgi:excisionase family DNA binding protein
LCSKRPPLKEVRMSKGALRISDLPIGKTKAYEEIRAGRLRAVKCGKLTLIIAEDYERWLKSLPPIEVALIDNVIQHQSR